MSDSGNLLEDDLVRSLIEDPAEPPSLMVLVGFLGRSATPGSRRLYVDALLSAFVEIPDEKIRKVQKLTPEQSPLGGHYLWVDRTDELVNGVRQALAASAQLQQNLGLGNPVGSGATLTMSSVPAI